MASKSQKNIKMKFFIPFSENKEQERKFYQSIKNFVSKEMEVEEFDKHKIFFIKFYNNNININIKVGKINAINGEIVIAILYEPLRKIFHVCTPSRGVVQGKPIVIPESNIIEKEYFDDC